MSRKSERSGRAKKHRWRNKEKKSKIAQDEESNISKQIKESEARSEKRMFEFIKGKRGIEGKQRKGNRRKQYDVPNWKD